MAVVKIKLGSFSCAFFTTGSSICIQRIMDSGCPVLPRFLLLFCFIICFRVRLCLRQRSCNILLFFFWFSRLVCPLFWCLWERVIYSICHLRMQAYHSDVLAKQVSWNLQLIGTQLRRNWHGYLCLCLDEWTVSLLSLLPRFTSSRVVRMAYSAVIIALSLSLCPGVRLRLPVLWWWHALSGLVWCVRLHAAVFAAAVAATYAAADAVLVPPLVLTPAVILLSTVCSNLSGGLTPFGSFSSSLVSACVVRRFPPFF